MKRSTILHALLTVIALFVLAAIPSRGDHILSATLSWEPAGTNTIRFLGTVYFHTEDIAGTGGLPADPNAIVVGSVYCEQTNGGGLQLYYGDGGNSGDLCFRVVEVNHDRGWVRTIAVLSSAPGANGITHAYGGAGSWNAEISGCCRIDEDVNNRMEDPFRLMTTVRSDGNSSPVSATMMPVILVPEAEAGEAQTFVISAGDPNNDNITYRIASNTEATGLAGSNGPASEAGQPGMSINPVTGVVTWYNNGLNNSMYYTQQFIAEDRDGNGQVKSQTPIDILLLLCEPSDMRLTVSLSSTSCSSSLLHLMTDICATVRVSGSCESNPTIVLQSITSSQPDHSCHLLDVCDDIQNECVGSYDRYFSLRREAYQCDRIYTITYAAFDDCGRTVTGSATFKVKCPNLLKEALAAKEEINEVQLGQSYPNPVTTSSSIDYTLPESDDIVVTIVNATGEEVRRLVSGPQDAGYHIIPWDGRDNNGEEVANGIYFCRLQSSASNVVRTSGLVVQR